MLPVFGYPYEKPLRYFLDDDGRPRVDRIVALGRKVGGSAATGAMLDRIGVPAINAITLGQHTAAQWQASKIGLDVIARSWQLAGAELAGLIQPTVVASRERVTDAETGLVYVEEQPIRADLQRQNAQAIADVEAAPMTSAASDQAEQAQVSGFEMQTLESMTHAQRTIGALALLILAMGLMGIGYWQRARAVAARPAATDTFKG